MTLPFWQPAMTGREQAWLSLALDADYINEGPLTERFERALAEHIGVRHVICTTSGTAALFLALKACGVGHGDKVAVPDLTFIATAHAVTLTGAEVVLTDVDERGLMIPPPDVDIVMPVHVSGRHADALGMATTYRNDDFLTVVEDACEAFPKKPEGVAACYSFSPNKVITTGQGGAIATDDDLLAFRIRTLKDHGRTQRGTGGDDEHPHLGFNFRFTDLQAAVGLAQLGALEERLARLRRNHALYAQSLDVVPFREGETPLWTDVLVDEPARLARSLRLQGVETRRYWKPLHRQPTYARAGEYLGADRFADHALWLPSAFTLTDADIERVVGIMRGVEVA